HAAGIAEEAFLDDIDGSFQPFIRYIPEKLAGRINDPSGAAATAESKPKSYPLIIYLHGYSPFLNIVNWSLPPEGLTGLADKLEAFMAMPFARGNTDFQGIGERDVLRVINEMRERFPVDVDRIILTGMSMGGMGVWNIGSHHVHLFAALVVISGRGDFYFWHKLDPEKVPVYQRLLIDREFAASHLPNLADIPIKAFHGSDDSLIGVEEARHMSELISPLNRNFEYTEIPLGDHWIQKIVFERPDLAEWLRETRRTTPDSFEFVSYHPSYNQAHWIFIAEYDSPSMPARVKAGVRDGKILIEASGTKSLVLDRDRMPPGIRDYPLEVLPASIKIVETADFANDNKPFRWGAVKDAFLQPFIFVNAGSEEEVFNNAVSQWKKFANAMPRIKKEDQLTAEDLRDFNIFLFGGHKTNPRINKVLKGSPVKIIDGDFIVGDERMPSDGKGLFLLRQSPWNPGKSVVIQIGLAWGLNCARNHMYDFIPGYMVYSPEGNPSDPFGGNLAVRAGFFNNGGGL
ncbi:MAG: prolyl oligopeptidase family serine peptidase, partial [Victivallales bacterium]|nr:prolyl oligopeptidase family serine peptidase [Victivallales bacterium]